MTKALNLLQSLVCLIVLLLFSMGRGAHGVFIAIFLGIPVFRLLLSSDYRQVLKFKLQGFLHGARSFRAAFWLVCFPSLLLSLVNGIGISSNDNYPVIMTAASILTEGDLEISEYTEAPRSSGREYCREGIPNPYYIRCTLDGVRSAYPIGMALVMLPTFAVAKFLGRDLYNADNQWRLSKWTASVLSGVAISLFFLIALNFVGVLSALIVSHFLVVGSTFTSIISQGPWSHDGVVLGILFLIFCETSYSERKIKFRSLMYGIVMAWAFSCRLNSVTMLVPFLVYVALQRGYRFSIVSGISSIFAYVPLALYYRSVYGTVFGPQMIMGMTSGIQAYPLSGVLGIFFSPAHGLIPYQPWVLLFLFYFVPIVRSKALSKMGWALLAVVLSSTVFQIAVVSQWWCWWGGTWGSRLMSEIVPLLALLVLFPVEYIVEHWKGLGKRALYLLMGVSFLFHAPHLFFFASNWNSDPLEGDLEGEARMWDWRSPPFLYPLLKKIRPSKKK